MGRKHYKDEHLGEPGSSEGLAFMPVHFQVDQLGRTSHALQYL